jgi:SAM-dependent methyltransferase
MPVKALIHRYAPRRLVNLGWNMAGDIKELPARIADSRPRPWRVVHNVGGGDFYLTGQAFFERFRNAVQLEPDAHVLDLGCGAGRLAVPICSYLNDQGRYTGFDIAQTALAFARRVTKGRCAITFHHADLSNPEYRKAGGDAGSYRFPADDASVDAAIATSLFSHLLPADTQAYLKETARVLKPGGRLVMTAFLLNDQDLAALEAGLPRLALQRFDAVSLAADPRHPERAIGFDESAFLSWVENAGLAVEGEIVRGDWRDPEPARREFQDRIVLVRRSG